ncbi:putative TBC1 domain family member 14 [Paratrimastix pyriformis]|uniref:TBC1 domain family member 14 n=1 Tax=Paratrimastix pyriformis TaxID=342808 RepID=A0ABQ8U8H2_9EUKA|nr:putative TBC1 domain family member 14 [Paratrimastix pyriformis]
MWVDVISLFVSRVLPPTASAFPDVPRILQWLTEILPDWEEKRQTKAVRALWRLGLPDPIRSLLWPKAIPNSLCISHELFQHKIREARRARHKRALLGKEKSQQDIFQDLNRTLSELPMFREPAYQSKLRDLLEAWVFLRPDVGYVQGMSFLGSLLLLHMDTYYAWLCFANMMSGPFFHPLFQLDNTGYRATLCELFNECFRQNMNALAARFQSATITTETFLPHWFMTVFIHVLPLPCACRIFDCYVLEGASFLFRAALGILKYYESDLLGRPDEELLGTVFRLKARARSIDADRLFECIGRMEVNQKKIDGFIGGF